MAWTQKHRDTLAEAIAAGVKMVAYSDRRVEYRSLEEMKRTLAMIDAALAKKKRVGRVYMNGSTGIRS